jgi:hypothetical protein
MHTHMNGERMSELLMLRATGAISTEEEAELASVMSSLPPGEVARWEHAAAELTVALDAVSEPVLEPMPAALRARLVQQGEAFVAAARPTSVVSNVVPARLASRSPWLGGAGWLAAAAALTLWVVSPRASNAPAPLPAVASVTALRDSLKQDSTATTLAWTATKDSSALTASGDVVWSGRAQRGVMRFAGLQPNDRSKWQYQLWIFDKTRDQKYPVDGGVFDVPAGSGEVVIPIDPRVPVGDAVMFAITVEKAGGVVVSTRERIALLAQRGS